MIGALLLVAAVGAGSPDPIGAAIERYRTVESYQVTLRSSHGDRTDIIRYSYKKPGHVRMDFVQPYGGAVLIYNPVAKEVRLWPFGGRFFSLTLSPENRLVQSATGQRVDRSDIGALLDNVSALQRSGATAVLGEEIIAGKKTVRLAVAGGGGFVAANVQRYDLWLDSVNLMPLKVVSRDVNGEIVETVLMDDLQINVGLADELFNP